ncbi:DMT family transporter [Celerinatantimonas sp. YJH-8]|uniref:DMT family transporter n=1 Tax=Celerinatantimonas sp. YJH-8 TaxID=3228714 RepID=UPI0038C31D28
MPYLCLIFAAIFWGGNYVVGRLLVVSADPFLLTQGRWLLTAVLLIVLYRKVFLTNIGCLFHERWVVLMLSLFGQVLFPLTLYIGLQYTSSLNAAIYMSATPAMVLVINRVIFKEHISKNNVAGVLLSSIGVLVLLSKGQWHQSMLSHLNQGDLWTMGSAVSWAFYCAFLRLKSKQLNGHAFVAASSLLGALMLLPVTVIYVIYHSHLNWEPYTHGTFMMGLAYLVIFPSWLSYVFWNRGIAELGATRGEIYTHIIPLSGGILGICFTDVQLAWYHIISAVFIILGIWLCSRFSSQFRHSAAGHSA